MVTRLAKCSMAAFLALSLIGIPAVALAEEGSALASTAFAPLSLQAVSLALQSGATVEESDDIRNDAWATAEVLDYNTVVHGSMSWEEDRDYYRISIPYNGKLMLTLREGDVDNPSNGWSVTLFSRPTDDNGRPIDKLLAENRGGVHQYGLEGGTEYDYLNIQAGEYLVLIKEVLPSSGLVTQGASYLLGSNYYSVDFSSAKVIVSDVQYNGSRQYPEPTVIFDGRVLTKGIDYLVDESSYVGNRKPGEAKVTVTGTGIYEGYVTQSFMVFASSEGAADSEPVTTPTSSTDLPAAPITSPSTPIITNDLTTASSVEQESGIPMYRMYNPWSGEHFYTASAPERSKLKKKGWKSEGIGWYAPDDGDPVYRLYNPWSGDHHFTRSAKEAKRLIKLGWRSEGVGWYSVPVKSKNKVPVFRQYNPWADEFYHNYTASKAENRKLIRAGWKAEGTAWYGVKI